MDGTTEKSYATRTEGTESVASGQDVVVCKASQLHLTSKTSKSTSNKQASASRFKKKHSNRSAEQNADMKNSSSSESSSSIDSSFLLDSNAFDKHLCTEKTAGKSSTPFSAPLSESPSQITNERGAFKPNASYYQLRKEPMGSENTSLSSFQNKVPVPCAKKHVSSIEESTTQSHQQKSSASGSLNFEGNIMSEQYEQHFASHGIRQHDVRPPLIGQLSDVLLRAGAAQSTSESSESVTSSISAESRDSLTYKVESLIGEKIVISRGETRHPDLFTLHGTSVESPLSEELLSKAFHSKIHPSVVGPKPKECVLSQEHSEFFSEQEPFDKAELYGFVPDSVDTTKPVLKQTFLYSDPMGAEVNLAMKDAPENSAQLHSQIPHQESLTSGPDALLENVHQNYMEKGILKNSGSKSGYSSFSSRIGVSEYPEEADVVAVSSLSSTGEAKDLYGSPVCESNVMTKSSFVALPNEVIGMKDMLSSGQLLSSEKMACSAHHRSHEYCGSHTELSGADFVKLPVHSYFSNQKLVAPSTDDHNRAHPVQNAKSSEVGLHSLGEVHSGTEFVTNPLSISDMPTATERTQSSPNHLMLTNVLSSGKLNDSSGSKKVSSEASFLSKEFLIHSSTLENVSASGLPNLPSSIQSSFLPSSHSPLSHLSESNTFVPVPHAVAYNNSLSYLRQSSSSQLEAVNSQFPISSSDRIQVPNPASFDCVTKVNVPTASVVSSTTSLRTNDFTKRISTTPAPLICSSSAFNQTAVFTGSFSDSAVGPASTSNISQTHAISVSRSAISDSENGIKKNVFGLSRKNVFQNVPSCNQHAQIKFSDYSVHSYPRVSVPQERPVLQGNQSSLTQKETVGSFRGSTLLAGNVGSKSDDDYDHCKLLSLKRQVTGSSSSSSSSSSSVHESYSKKSLSDQEAERSLSEITVSAESIQTIISAPGKSSNDGTEAEVSDELKNEYGCTHVKSAQTSAAMKHKYLPVKIHSNTSRSDDQHVGSFVSTGFDPQLSSHVEEFCKQRLRCLSANSNDADIDESAKSEYQSDHRESPTSVSSLASSKRLEWDNGADIGYETTPGMSSNLERLKPSDFALLFRSDPEGGALSNKKKMLFGQPANTMTQLISPNTAAATPVENTSSHTAASFALSKHTDHLSKGKNQHRLSPNSSNDHSSSRKYTHVLHPSVEQRELNFYDVSVQTEPKYFTKEVGIQARLSSQGKNSLSSSASSDNTVKVSSKSKECRLNDRSAVPPSEKEKAKFHLRETGQPLHHNKVIHEGLREESSKTCVSSSFNRDHASSLFSGVSYTAYSLAEGDAVDQNFQLNVENSGKSSENSSDDLDSHSGHTKYFTDISNLQLQFPYPQPFLPSNISSVLVFDENSAYPEFLSDGADLSELGDNVVFLRSTDHEPLLSDQTDGPHIRWYPVSGRSDSQEIRDAATQTAVSYISEQDPEAYVDSPSEQSQENNSSNTASSAQGSESGSLYYYPYNKSSVKRFPSSGRENILPSDIRQSHYFAPDLHIDPNEIRPDAAVSHSLQPPENQPVSYHKPSVLEEIVPKSIIFSSLHSAENETNSEYASFPLNSKLSSQSHGKPHQYEFHTLNDDDIPQSKDYDTVISKVAEHVKCHPSPVGTKVPSNHDTHTGSVSSWNSVQQIPSQVRASNFPSAAEVLQFPTGRSTSKENVHYKVLKFMAKETDCKSDTVIYNHQKTIFPSKGKDKENVPSSESESFSLGQTQSLFAIPSYHSGVKEKQYEKSKGTTKTVSERTQTFENHRPITASHSLDGTSHIPSVSSEYNPYQNEHTSKKSVKVSDERENSLRSLHGSQSENLRRQRIGGVGGNVNFDNQYQFISKFHSSLNSNVDTSLDTVPHISSNQIHSEVLQSKADLEASVQTRQPTFLREGARGLQTDWESAALTSLSQSETAESAHTGSDDAVPPKFPLEALGSRRDPAVPSPGIYGNKKFIQKYGHGHLKKFPSDSDLYDSKHSEHLGSYVVKQRGEESVAHKNDKEAQESSSDVVSTSQTGVISSEQQTNASSERVVKQKMDVTDMKDQEDMSLNQIPNDQKIMYQADSTQSEQVSGKDQRDMSLNRTKDAQEVLYQASSTQSEQLRINTVESSSFSKSESSDVATVSMSSECPPSHDKVFENANKTNALHLDDPENSRKDSSELSETASEPKSKIAQRAKFEISKLKSLVDRQKKNYLRRLQLEVERLTRLEDLVKRHTSKYASFSSSSVSSNGNDDQTIPKYVSTEDAVNQILQQLGHPRGSAISYDSETSVMEVSNVKRSKIPSVSVPKYRNVKIQVSLGNSLQNNMQHKTTDSLKPVAKYNVVNEYTQKKDFGQSYPTPVSSDHDFIQTKSVGIQTSDSLLNGETFSKCNAEKVRFFISLDGAQKKEKSKKPNSRKLVEIQKPTKPCPRFDVPPSTSWSVSHRRSSDWRQKTYGAHKNYHAGLSLQDAFHRNCGHLIRRSQGRLMRITKLAELRRRLTALALERARLGQSSHYRIACLKNAIHPLKRHFTHMEIKLQTERVYKKLPEVVELKEKKKREEMYRTNRLMAEIYKKKLQEQVLKGKVNWTISQTCLTA